MAGTAKTSKLSRVAVPAPAPTTPNFFITGLTLHDGVRRGSWQPVAMNAVNYGRHSFSNQGGADGRVPVATTVKIYETVIEAHSGHATRCVLHLVHAETGAILHSFDSAQRAPGGGDLCHFVHDPPIEFTVPANDLLIQRVWIDGPFKRIAVLQIGTRS